MRLKRDTKRLEKCLRLWAENAEPYSIRMASHEVDLYICMYVRTNLRVYPALPVIAVIKWQRIIVISVIITIIIVNGRDLRFSKAVRGNLLP